MPKSRTLNDEKDTLAFGERCAQLFSPGNIIYLQGELGSGKTTFVRGCLRGFGFQGSIKSPTYTLVEPYEFSWGILYHFDLYRIQKVQELESMGIREYFDKTSLVLIEWPERGLGLLPKPDLELTFKHKENSREVSIEPLSHFGKTISQQLQ